MSRHASKIPGARKGFDRLLFRGHLGRRNFAEGVDAFLRRQGPLMRHFGKLAGQVTAMIVEEAASIATIVSRPTP